MDEPDIVKTDGEKIVALAQGKLRVVVLGKDKPDLEASLAVEGAGAAPAARNRAVVVSHTYGGRPLPADTRLIAPMPTKTVLTEVDLSTPSRPRVVRTLTLDASYLDARLVGSSLRVVLTSPPPIAFEPPSEPGPTGERKALEQNRSKIRSSRARDWLPTYTLRNRRTGAKKTATAARLQPRRPPVALLRPRRPQRRHLRPGQGPRPRRHRRRDDGRPDDLRLEVEPLRGDAALDRVGRARERQAAAPDDRAPPLRHLRPAAREIPGDRRGDGVRHQPVRDVRARRRAAGGVDRVPALVGRRPDRLGELRDDARAAWRTAREARPPGRPRQGRAHLRRPLHRRRRLRRHVPAGRPAVRRRPLPAVGPGCPRRAEDPRLLGVPPSARPRPAARPRAGRDGGRAGARNPGLDLRRLGSAPAGPAAPRDARQGLVGGGVGSPRLPLLAAGDARRAARAGVGTRAERRGGVPLRRRRADGRAAPRSTSRG